MTKNEKRGEKETSDRHGERDLVFAEDINQRYAKVMCMVGKNHAEAECIGSTTQLCCIPRSMKNRVRISRYDIILVRLRAYHDGKAEVIFRYLPEEARLLKSYGYLPEFMAINQPNGKEFCAFEQN